VSRLLHRQRTRCPWPILCWQDLSAKQREDQWDPEYL